MNEHSSDILQTQGINSQGFGIIPKLVMQDKRLSITSKAIYGYFASFAGAGRTAFPSVGKIISDLGVNKDTYYKHFKPLKDYGYIISEQEKCEDGKFKRNIYTLVDIIPYPNFSDTAEPDTVLPDTVNQDTKSNNLKNNSFKNNNLKKREREALPPVEPEHGEYKDLSREDVVTEFSDDEVDDCLERVALHSADTGRVYNYPYRTVRKWLRQERKQQENNPKQQRATLTKERSASPWEGYMQGDPD